MRRALPWVIVVVACNASSPADTLANVPAALKIAAGDAQTGVPGYRLATQVAVKVVDASGRPVTGYAVVFAPTDSTGVAEPAATLTDSTGTARTFWRLGGSLGTQKLAASVQGLLSATWSATATSNTMLAIDGGSFNVYTGTSGAMCGIDRQGSLGCWALPHPGAVDPPARFVPISASVRFTSFAMVNTYPLAMPNACALATTGTIWCFALDSLANVTTFAPVIGNYPPFTSIAASGFLGQDYCALTAAGAAWCWGWGSDGNIGDGGFDGRAAPTLVATTTRLMQIVSGDGTTCGLAFDATAWCWGGNDADQAGTTSLAFPCICVPLPVQVSSTLTFSRLFNMSKNDAFCGIATVGGLYCWGQLFGLAYTPQRSPIPSAAFAGGSPIVDAAAPWYSLMALRQDGTITAVEGVGDRISITAPPHIAGVLSGFLSRNGGGWACGPARGSTATLCVSTSLLQASPVVGVPMP
jgi:hypothetical protein